MDNNGIVDIRFQSVPTRVADVEEDRVCLRRGWVKKADVMTPEEALAYCDEQLKASPNDASLWRLRGVAWMGKAWGDKTYYRNALHSLDEALRHDPSCAEALTDRGRIRTIKKDYSSALLDFAEAIRLDPADPNPYLRRGLLHLRERAFEDARADCTQAINLDPGSEHAYTVRGGVAFVQDDRKSAESDYGEAIRCNPRVGEALENRALLRLKNRDADRALHDINDAIRLRPQEPHYFFIRGCCWFMKKDDRKALEDLTESIRLRPNHPTAYLFRAYLYQSLEKDQLALQDFEVVSRFDPNDLGLICEVAWLLATTSDDDVRDGKRAIDFAKKACQRTEWKVDSPIAALAAGYAAEGDWENATHFQTDAISKAPKGGRERRETALQLYRNRQMLRIPKLQKRDRLETTIAEIAINYDE
jgi:tetratricopeptide (TPR) repeat protein